MADVNVPANVESLTIDAVVTRRDGTVEDIGRIVEYHRNSERSVPMADSDGVNPGTVLGQYRIEVADESGTSHYGPVYSTRDEADGDLQAAQNANPDATVKVVALKSSESGKTATWEDAGA